MRPFWIHCEFLEPLAMMKISNWDLIRSLCHSPEAICSITWFRQPLSFTVNDIPDGDLPIQVIGRSRLTVPICFLLFMDSHRAANWSLVACYRPESLWSSRWGYLQHGRRPRLINSDVAHEHISLFLLRPSEAHCLRHFSSWTNIGIPSIRDYSELQSRRTGSAIHVGTKPIRMAGDQSTIPGAIQDIGKPKSILRMRITARIRQIRHSEFIGGCSSLSISELLESHWNHARNPRQRL